MESKFSLNVLRSSIPKVISYKLNMTSVFRYHSQSIQSTFFWEALVSFRITPHLSPLHGGERRSKRENSLITKEES
ncbi:MAG: hypothetical protein A2149_03950 [Candidatus Schekmanbacteria bacterium RBG_16_38_11]|uniref:Uncharacterized protein n=1 Tax=Candidatus Schekmanbacteria bacterium RBG_16_38_11 TaxID=1817880 RepID=A0A1F7RTT3_9BACT|nr:MAG: hypothetical protein A2149_03950 [Candidatus Schekmanbacteria bacterium RBG_16_38_11]